MYMNWQLQIDVKKSTFKIELHTSGGHRRHIVVKAGGPGCHFRHINSKIELK